MWKQATLQLLVTIILLSIPAVADAGASPVSTVFPPAEILLQETVTPGTYNGFVTFHMTNNFPVNVRAEVIPKGPVISGTYKCVLGPVGTPLDFSGANSIDTLPVAPLPTGQQLLLGVQIENVNLSYMPSYPAPQQVAEVLLTVSLSDAGNGILVQETIPVTMVIDKTVILAFEPLRITLQETADTGTYNGFTTAHMTNNFPVNVRAEVVPIGPAISGTYKCVLSPVGTPLDFSGATGIDTLHLPAAPPPTGQQFLLGIQIENVNLSYMPSYPAPQQVAEVLLTVSLSDVGSGILVQEIIPVNITLAETVLTADIDIKPGSCPNPLNVKSKGVLPVAILGSKDFYVGMIDVASIRLAGVAPIRSRYKDVAAPMIDGQECECTTEGPDDYLDLTLKFKTQEIVEALGEVVNGEEWVLTLTGELSDETPIEGADCIRIKAPKAKRSRGVKKPTPNPWPGPTPTPTPTPPPTPEPTPTPNPWPWPTPTPTIETVIDINPDTLNLKSEGRWINCHIWFPEGIGVDDVDINTIVLKKDGFEVGGEYGEFQTGKLMVKFPRFQVQDMLVELDLLGEVDLTVTGELVDGTKFGGSDTIRVINKGGKK